jgi:beta-glucanase (GH16 family)
MAPRFSRLTVVRLLLLVMPATLASPAAAQCDRLPGCSLVWSDEFDGTAVNSSRWEFMTGDGTNVGLPAGWGNNELEYYQPENAAVSGGFLTITAREESVGGYDYTSARLRTLGLGDWTYGRMEMRARMPVGQGLWPAFWMLPSDPSIYGGWAASGEIDIVEYVGSDPDRVFGTIHFGSPWPNNVSSSSEYRLSSGTFHDDFHVFAIEWERGEIRWYVDGIHYGTKTDWFSSGGSFPAPFDVDFHILLNLAVGGNLPGSPDSTTTFPQELVVDYVRVYQAAAVKGSQVGATGLLYEKRVKMKKVEVFLSMSFENQARKKDSPRDPRHVWCTVTAQGKTGPLAAKGKVLLRLVGEDPVSPTAFVPWQSSVLSESIDAQGDAAFEENQIQRLVNEAQADGARIQYLHATFDGGKGKKVEQATLDCMQAPAGG